MPDCTLTFEDPYKLDDCAFHPCVRYQRFEVDQQLSFIPPDGKFKLLSFVARCVFAYPAVSCLPMHGFRFVSERDLLASLQRLWSQLTDLCQAIGLFQWSFRPH